MSSAAGVLEQASPQQRLEELFDELAELSGQRNAIDGRLVQIVAELDRVQLWGMTGCRSAASMVAWKLGITPRNAEMNRPGLDGDLGYATSAVEVTV